MGSYTHFTLSERKYLQKLLSEGKSFREIAAILERNPSSISREVNRNRAKHKPKHKSDNAFWYNHRRAADATRRFIISFFHATVILYVYSNSEPASSATIPSFSEIFPLTSGVSFMPNHGSMQTKGAPGFAHMPR